MHPSPRFHIDPQTDRANAERPVIVYVLSWQDARLDLAIAGDLRTRLGTEFDSHFVQFHEPDIMPLSERGAYHIPRAGADFAEHLESLIRSLQPDIVHTHSLRDFETVLPAVSRAGVPHLVHRVESPVRAENTVGHLQEGLFLQAAGALAVVPNSDLIPKGWAGTAPWVIPTGIDCDRFSPGDAEQARRKVGLPLGPKIVGCGSMSEHLDPLIQAIFRSRQDIHLALFGPGVPTSAQRQRIRRLGLDERIHVVGPWAEPELIYRAIDAYFHGPDENPVPRQILAAQAVGKPVIATRPVREESLCPQNGHLLPTLFVPALTSAIQRMVAGVSGESIRRFIETNWNSDRMVGAYREMFHALIAESDGRSLPSVFFKAGRVAGA